MSVSLSQLTVTEERPWVAEAKCVGKTHLFFAPPGERSQRRGRREALATSYCNQCLSRIACRQWARTNRESGFWGGESDEERAAAGYPPRSPNRRAVAEAGREARRAGLLEHTVEHTMIDDEYGCDSQQAS